jgi:quercetin dioxygenase-like cupin family protein
MKNAEILRPAEGIQIIDRVVDQFGVDTLEGRVGPLIQGEESQAIYLDMPAGLYCEEHPHPHESITYSVRGRWVLCTEGKRRLMEPGSLFWFGSNITTGYEVPFDEPAYILCFGCHFGGAEQFVDYLETSLQTDSIDKHEAGKPYLLMELSDDHPARAFARSVNPDGGF